MALTYHMSYGVIDTTRFEVCVFSAVALCGTVMAGDSVKLSEQCEMGCECKCLPLSEKGGEGAYPGVKFQLQ